MDKLREMLPTLPNVNLPIPPPLPTNNTILRSPITAFREHVNGAITSVGNTQDLATAEFSSRLRPLANQARPVLTKLPISAATARDTYPEAASAVAGVLAGVPAFITRGKFAGGGVGVISGLSIYGGFWAWRMMREVEKGY